MGTVPAGGATSHMWGATFLSKHILVSRDELLTLLRGKLGMTPGMSLTLANNLVLAKNLQWEFYGS